MTDTNKLKELAWPKEDVDTQWKLEDAKEKIVEAMCMTWRHDFGLSKRHGQFGSSGMTPDEQNSLRSRMGQLFDHHIAHFVRDEEERSRSLFTLESGILSLQSDLIDELRAEAERLRQGMKGDYDIDAWLDWSKEKERIKSENEELRGALQAVVDDPTWRSNDNTLWPKIIKAMDRGATQ
ncbi:hypothetical protein N0517_10755 [Pseudomonas aeruginosa]|nr:hypothetical protein [Pseudomonas aeruginosa]MCS9421237.1 hypothetical protein [Pseudomonas aeruginosa]MCS9546898.1 hypothetical protein [Pseudomonas aeruginosa]